jgi:7-carboxy-7-deazaguanine synthase
MTKLRVSEVFYSLQGEGARVGEPSIFVRLQGCSAKHACAQSGVVCDTEFESGDEMSLDNLSDLMLKVELDATGSDTGKCVWIVWTGGEPLDQLTPDILQHFVSLGFKQALETSGVRALTRELSEQFNHVTVSPKVAEHILARHFTVERDPVAGYVVDELRYVRHAGQVGVPQPSIWAKYHYLSPHSDGGEINRENLNHCIKLCLENPRWRLSVQQHKIWRLL